MKKILFLILAMMMFAFQTIAGESTTSTSSSQGIMLEIAQYRETIGRHRAPMRIGIEAWYNAESNTINIIYDGEAEGEVFLYLNGNVVGYTKNLKKLLCLN